jgi:hypothetical protein
MATDRTHQFKILLSPEEKAQLDGVAASRGLTASDVLRQHIREAHAELEEGRRLQALQAEQPTEEQDNVLYCFAGEDLRSTLERGAIAIAINQSGVDAKWGGLNRVLNELRHSGFLFRTPAGYRLTAKGTAYVATHWRPVPPR